MGLLHINVIISIDTTNLVNEPLQNKNTRVKKVLNVVVGVANKQLPSQAEESPPSPSAPSRELLSDPEDGKANEDGDEAEGEEDEGGGGGGEEDGGGGEEEDEPATNGEVHSASLVPVN